MKNSSFGIPKEEFNNFFSKFDKVNLAIYIEKLIIDMKKKLVFDVIVLNASIHFTKNNNIFSACGFRRKQNYFLVEFFSKTNIHNKRIVKEIGNKYTEKKWIHYQ